MFPVGVRAGVWRADEVLRLWLDFPPLAAAAPWTGVDVFSTEGMAAGEFGLVAEASSVFAAEVEGGAPSFWPAPATFACPWWSAEEGLSAAEDSWSDGGGKGSPS